MTHIERKRYIAVHYPTYGELLNKFMETDTRRWELEDWLDQIGPKIFKLRRENERLQSEVEHLTWALRRERAKQK